MTRFCQSCDASTEPMGAAVLFTDAAGRALLVEPIYKDYWELVGG